MKVLLTEGTSTSARQTIYALGRGKAIIDICDSQAFGLGRFSRYVRKWHRAPSYTADPRGYLTYIKERLRCEAYDVLFPVHDQVYLLSRFRDELNELTAIAVPPFSAIEQVQSKSNLIQLFHRLELPYPATKLVQQPQELIDSHATFPCYIKLAYSTAGRGVWLIRNQDELNRLAERLTTNNQRVSHGILVQQPATGTFSVTQAVFQHGRLVAAHSYFSRAPGVGGSAHARESVSHPKVIADLARLGKYLDWHGALHIEYFYDEQTGRREYLEINPRIGETMNATLSGLNLCQVLVDVSLGNDVTAVESIPGIKTHSLLMSLMGAAERGTGRCSLIAELWRAACRGGIYRNSSDELVRPLEDPLSVIPAIAVVSRLLIQPGSARRMIAHAVDNYGLNAAAVERIREYVATPKIETKS